MKTPSTRALVAVLLGLLVVGGCVPAPAGSGAAPPAGSAYVRAIRPDEADLWRGQNYQGLLLDVRNPDEWAATPGLLEGARRIPLGELESRLDDLAAFRGKPVRVFCKDGPRANAAAQLLARHGFQQVAYLDGGI
jgi:rhodanese-related sulfurtransferase